MRDRDAENLRMALVSEWAAASWLGLEPGLELPSSAEAARHNEWRDGGVDVVTRHGARIDVKASRPRYPELMIPVKHERKFRRDDCPVDVFLKAVVWGLMVQFTCWIERWGFMLQCHRDEGQRYPQPTLWMSPDEAYRIEDVVVSVPDEVGAQIDAFISDDVPDQPWRGWLTL